MKLWIAAVISAGLIGAQNPEKGASYLGQTRVGLLVSGSCPSNSIRNAGTEEANRTVTDRVTTPAVDSSGTRGSSEQTKTTPAARGDVPQTGDLSTRDKGKIRDPGWKQARRQASSLDSTCRVTRDTRAFSLLLPDGSALRFDDLANTKIAEQLQQRGMSGDGRILRVQVIGKLENGTFALGEIRM